MFSQETINTVVGIDIVLGIIFVAAIAIYSAYRYADYLLFVHRLNKHAKRDNRKDVPTIVRMGVPEIDPAGGYFHYFKLDKAGKTMLNDNELAPWMVDAAISEQEYDARGSK